jgi:kumamolisin
LTAYFKTLGLAAPAITAVSVDKGKNKPTNANSADGEVMLDIEVAASVAPGAKIVVYFTPNTDQGFTDAITTAVHDTTHKPSVISISWGGPESSWTGQSSTVLDAACQSAAALGVTITVAAGDNGSTDGGRGTMWIFRRRARMCWLAEGRSWTPMGRRLCRKWCGTRRRTTRARPAAA